MTASVSTVQNILKTLYPQKRLPRFLFSESPFLGMMKHTTGFYGNNAQISNRYSGTSGGSADFSTAQANVGGNKYGKFLITRAKDYSIIQIETEAVRAASHDAGALTKTIEEEAKGGWYTIKRSMSRTVWGNGGGARGQISSGQTTDTLTLTNPEDIVNFEVGMVIVPATTDGTSGAVLPNNPTTITAIDEDAGTITAGANFHADFADGNYLFREGDFGAMAKGFDAWIPATAPTSGDSFFGFDRSVHVNRHAGIRYTATVQDGSIERSLVSATSRGMRSGAKPNTAFMHPVDFGLLVNQLGTKATYEMSPGQAYEGKKADFGFKGLCLWGVSNPAGRIVIHPDADAPKGVAALVRIEDWEFMALGKLPGFIDDDGKGQWLRTYNADAMEARIGYYGQVVCHAPVNQIRVDLSAVL